MLKKFFVAGALVVGFAAPALAWRVDVAPPVVVAPYAAPQPYYYAAPPPAPYYYPATPAYGYGWRRPPYHRAWCGGHPCHR